jgi:hypothetical protein
MYRKFTPSEVYMCVCLMKRIKKMDEAVENNKCNWCITFDWLRNEDEEEIL